MLDAHPSFRCCLAMWIGTVAAIARCADRIWHSRGQPLSAGLSRSAFEITTPAAAHGQPDEDAAAPCDDRPGAGRHGGYGAAGLPRSERIIRKSPTSPTSKPT